MKHILLISFLLGSILAAQSKPVKTGADVLFESRFSLIKGKRIGLVTNHSAVLSSGKHLADALFENKQVTLVALFGPEHGVRGNAPDGRTIRDTIDEKTGVPVYSLYGKINKPTREMLKDIDLLVFDIQDVGTRFYTFISTMFLSMEAAAENKIPFIVLDRPNPITGEHVDGPIRLDSLKTFVGWVPIPIAHGMTVGELAMAANREGWLKDRQKADLTVVTMKGWKRSMWYDETKLPWIKPSPNMASLSTAVVYPGTCLIEGINVSEGRGTEKPFEYIGAPWINGNELATLLNQQQLPGVTFRPIEFTPREIPLVTSNPKHEGKNCGGVFLVVTERESFQPVKTGLALVWGIHSLYKDSLKFRERGFDRLMGTPVPRIMIQEGKKYDEIFRLWKTDLEAFFSIRKAALLY